MGRTVAGNARPSNSRDANRDADAERLGTRKGELVRKRMRCNGKIPTRVQGRARSCRSVFRGTQCGMTERTARGDRQRSSEMHDCSRQNPAYCAVQASKANKLCSFAFEPNKQKECNDYRRRENSEVKTLLFFNPQFN